ncbi:unnamed protein product [Closterium sp. NIES-64]|nr:unnamed protein product [Closterium sp. NIES-64]
MAPRQSRRGRNLQPSHRALPRAQRARGASAATAAGVGSREMKEGYVEDTRAQGSGCNSVYWAHSSRSVGRALKCASSCSPRPPLLLTRSPASHTATAFIAGLYAGLGVERGGEGEEGCHPCSPSLGESVGHGGLVGQAGGGTSCPQSTVPALLALFFAISPPLLLCYRLPLPPTHQYSSVTEDGKVRWQDALTAANRCCFRACHAIFTNYSCQHMPLMLLSPALASTTAPPCHALPPHASLPGPTTTTTPHQGRAQAKGFATGQAVSVALQRGASAAVFAPAWVYETRKGESFDAAQERERNGEEVGGGEGYGSAFARPSTRAAPTPLLATTARRARGWGTGVQERGIEKGEQAGGGMSVAGEGGERGAVCAGAVAGECSVECGGEEVRGRFSVFTVPTPPRPPSFFFPSLPQGVGTNMWLSDRQVASSHWSNFSCQTWRESGRAAELEGGKQGRRQGTVRAQTGLGGWGLGGCGVGAFGLGSWGVGGWGLGLRLGCKQGTGAWGGWGKRGSGEMWCEGIGFGGGGGTRPCVWYGASAASALGAGSAATGVSSAAPACVHMSHSLGLCPLLSL